MTAQLSFTYHPFIMFDTTAKCLRMYISEAFSIIVYECNVKSTRFNSIPDLYLMLQPLYLLSDYHLGSLTVKLFLHRHLIQRQNSL